jgi:GNAT superfamily N-acetyltransferase
MNFSRVQTDPAHIEQYKKLFHDCFPTAGHFTAEYLSWLYRDNPDGLVVGFDAYDGPVLAAHYVCIPVRVVLNDRVVMSLLSLNTATHPTYQGKGLFTKLAEKTYEAGAAEGFACVYGVANSNSTPGFVRKLGFQLVSPLDARIGWGRLPVDWGRASAQAVFQRHWSTESLHWRCANPSNPVRIVGNDNGILQLSAKASTLLRAYGELPFAEATEQKPFPGEVLHPRLVLGLFPAGSCSYSRYFNVPSRLRPSPLNMIYKSLSSDINSLDPGRVLFSFVNFDAY